MTTQDLHDLKQLFEFAILTGDKPPLTKSDCEMVVAAVDRVLKSEWRPIESAPRDGANILLFANIKTFRPPHGRISVGNYSTDPVYIDDKLCGLEEGWKGKEDGCIPINQHIFTHWKLLPDPPKVSV